MDKGTCSYNGITSYLPCVIKESDTSYKMWFSGDNGTGTRILYSTSTDGINNWCLNTNSQVTPKQMKFTPAVNTGDGYIVITILGIEDRYKVGQKIVYSHTGEVQSFDMLNGIS